MRISVLDQSPIPEGSTPGQALRNSIELAQVAERSGYYRYWVAEHHGTPGLACNSPEVLIGPIAAATGRIRVGSGGVMLPHYSPLKVAETFSMLGGMYPGRIDLGLGRAAGTSPSVAVALQRDRRQRPPDDFPEQLAELLSYFAGEPKGPFPMLRDRFFHAVDPWLLGSSIQSSIWAAEMGLPYVFADFINPEGEAAAAYYHQQFKPSRWADRPRMGVAVWAVCAETTAEAQRLASSARMMMTMLFRGQLIPVPSVEKAMAFLEREGVPAEELPVGRRLIAGDPPAVRKAIEAVAREYEAEEVLLVNILYDHQSRCRSYELVAGALASGG